MITKGRDSITYTVDGYRHQDIRCLVASLVGQGREENEMIRKDYQDQ